MIRRSVVLAIACAAGAVVTPSGAMAARERQVATVDGLAARRQNEYEVA